MYEERKIHLHGNQANVLKQHLFELESLLTICPRFQSVSLSEEHTLYANKLCKAWKLCIHTQYEFLPGVQISFVLTLELKDAIKHFLTDPLFLENCTSGLMVVKWWCITLTLLSFKQKTAYEILRCDWSSDVCSSDLIGRAHVWTPVTP